MKKLLLLLLCVPLMFSCGENYESGNRVLIDKLTNIGDAFNIFESDNEIGFVYADFANIYENGQNFRRRRL